MRRSAAFLALVAGLPMLVGGVTYLLWRDTGLLMFRWVEAVGLWPALAEARAAAAPLRDRIPDWWLYSVPDGAWVFSATAFFAWLWPDGPRWMRAGWIGLAFALAMGGELLQIPRLVPGTWDPADALSILLAAAGALAAERAWRRRAPLPLPRGW